MTDSGSASSATDEFKIRPPQQERTRRSWARILDAGVALVEEGGYEAFTIAAVCDRAQVAPRAIYDRTTSKDALFLAVYEHGISRILADQEVFGREDRWKGLDAPGLITAAVTEVAAMFGRHAAFLKPIVLLSGAHPEVHRRGRAYSHLVSDQFTTVVLRAEQEITHPDPPAAVRLCFNTVFASLVLRVSYGADFTAPAVDDATFTRHLTQMAVRYLLGNGIP